MSLDDIDEARTLDERRSRSSKQFSTYFVARAKASIKAPVAAAFSLRLRGVAARAASAKMHGSHAGLFTASVSVDGMLSIFLFEGDEEVASVATGVVNPTYLVAGSMEHPLVVISNGKKMVVYSFTARYDGHYVAGLSRTAAKREADDIPLPGWSFTFSIHGEREADVSLLQIYSQRRIVRILLATKHGSLHILHANATNERVITPEEEKPVRSMAAAINQLAVAIGDRVRFFNPLRGKFLPTHCSGARNADITSIAFDVLAPSIMYASTDSSVYVFNTRSVSKASGKASSGCRIVFKLDYDTPATELHTLRGYLVVHAGKDISVYNTTNILFQSPEHVFTRTWHTSDPISTCMMSVGTSRFTSDEYISVHVQGASLTVYESLLPHTRNTGTSPFGGWSRAPLFIGGIVCMFIYQYMNRKREHGVGMMPPVGMMMPPSMPAMGRGIGASGRGKRSGARDDWRARYGQGDNFDIRKFVADFEQRR